MLKQTKASAAVQDDAAEDYGDEYDEEEGDGEYDDEDIQEEDDDAGTKVANKPTN